MSELHKAMHIAASGMLAQNVRVRVISQNIANSDSLATQPGEQPYRRQTVSFRSELDRGAPRPSRFTRSASTSPNSEVGSIRDIPPPMKMAMSAFPM